MMMINVKGQALIMVLSVTLIDIGHSFVASPIGPQHPIMTNRAWIPENTILRAEASDGDDEREGDATNDKNSVAVNVLGTALQPCCTDVGGTGIGTGFYRDGYCATGEQDLGRHTVCCQVTDEFLKFSASVGNDLSTPAPQYYFPGLKGMCIVKLVNDNVLFSSLVFVPCN